MMLTYFPGFALTLRIGITAFSFFILFTLFVVLKLWATPKDHRAIAPSLKPSYLSWSVRFIVYHHIRVISHIAQCVYPILPLFFFFLRGTASEHGLRCAAASNCGKSAHSPETCRRCARLSELLSPAFFLFPALPSFLRSFLQNLHLSFSVFLSPLFGHCICNTRKCFCSVLGPVSRKHPFVLLSMLFAVRARRTPCCNRCHNVCWKQRWQIF